jgi:3-deoxy-D-manno-octulosonic-acid transferase
LRLLYSIGINIASVVLQILAVFNNKLKLGVKGRKKTFDELENSIESNDKTLWFHCASLGEYEQGLPVFEKLRHDNPDYKIVLTFFSPSGFEVRKNTAIADVVVYLPLDTKRNAKRFLDLINPEYIIFVKYEIWPNFLNEVKKRNINAILISALFRKNQSFFKWYGRFMRTSLFAFHHIFTQDQNSKELLESINYTNVTITGDTRFDRVSNQLKIDNSLSFIEDFKSNQLCIVFGSTWPEDDKLFIDFINNSDNQLKFIIAPHNIKSNYIDSLKSQIKVNTVSYSSMTNKDLSTYKVFILDTIGYLSKVYSYADVAYVGGGAGQTGLHNILEPSVFGIPLIIGKNYSKFPEAKRLIDLGGLTSVENSYAFTSILSELISNTIKRENQGLINKQFIEKNKGAVVQILNYIRI